MVGPVVEDDGEARSERSNGDRAEHRQRDDGGGRGIEKLSFLSFLGFTVAHGKFYLRRLS